MKKTFTRAALHRLSLTELSALFCRQAQSPDQASAKANQDNIRKVITEKRKPPKPPCP